MNLQRVLFVCGRNRRRSPTAEAVFAGRPGLEVSSAGVAPDAECPVSGDLLEWADTVVVMEERHARSLRRRFGLYLRDKRMVTLSIADHYEAMDAELIEVLKSKRHLWLREA